MAKPARKMSEESSEDLTSLLDAAIHFELLLLDKPLPKAAQEKALNLLESAFVSLRAGVQGKTDPREVAGTVRGILTEVIDLMARKSRSLEGLRG